MENIFFTQYSVKDLRQLFRRELQIFFQNSREVDPTHKTGGQLITLSQAAKILGISEKKLAERAAYNDILHYRCGEDYYFLESEMKETTAA